MRKAGRSCDPVREDDHFDTTHELATLDEFIQALNPKVLLHTAEYLLLVVTHSCQMNGDWRFHTIIQTDKFFISEYFHGTLLINMLEALDSYLQRKVITEPKAAALKKAIEWTWVVFHRAQPPAP